MTTVEEEIASPLQAILGERPHSDTAFRRRVLLLVGTISGLISFDWASTNVSLATVRDRLHFTPAGVPWIISAYMLTFGGFLLLGGRLADLYGRRRLLLIGMGVFSVFSVFSALAPNAECFVLARFFKGIGAALVAPNTYALLNSLFSEGKRRNSAMGTFSLLGGIGYALGNLLGGTLTSVSWRLTVSVGAVASAVLFALVARWLPKKEAVHAHGGFDLLGAVLSTLGFGLLIFTVSKCVQLGAGSPVTLVLFGLSLAALAGFVISNRRHRFPIVPAHLLRSRNVIGAAVVSFFLMGSGQGTFFQVALFLQDVFKFSVKQTGLALIPFVLMGLLSTLFIGRILNRLGFLRTLLLGLLINVVSITYFAFLTKKSGYLFGLLPGLLFWDFGFPLAMVGVKIPAGSGLEPKDQGIANGFNYAVEQLGAAFGVTLFGAINLAGQGWARSTGSADATAGFHWAFAASVVFILVGVAGAIFILRESPISSREQAVPAVLVKKEAV
jgi:MFS family permease